MEPLQAKLWIAVVAYGERMYFERTLFWWVMPEGDNYCRLFEQSLFSCSIFLLDDFLYFVFVLCLSIKIDCCVLGFSFDVLVFE